MPWQQDGTFLRVNPDYSAKANGDLWGQDLAAQPSIKIIATRHDYHDQDIGDGIAACLNLDGLNSMRANLNMGAFKITNIGVAVALTDIPQYGQIAGEIDYSDSTKVLTLNDRNGDPIDTTIIDLTGVGAGITELSGDGSGTVVLTPDPITGTGTAGLEVLGTGQTYLNGIAAITIDNWGRVTQVTQGAFDNEGEPDQTLIKDQNYTNAIKLELTQSDGSNIITLNEASTIRGGIMPNSAVSQLESLEGAPDGDDIPSTQAVTQWDAQQNFKEIQMGFYSIPGLLNIGIALNASGEIRMPGLPTSDPNSLNQLWNDGGILTVSSG